MTLAFIHSPAPERGALGSDTPPCTTGNDMDTVIGRGIYQNVKRAVAIALVMATCLSCYVLFVSAMRRTVVWPQYGMTTGQIIGGRLRGLWGQFLPSIVLLLGIWVYLETLPRPRTGDFLSIWFFLVTFAVVPVIGLYFSLRCKSFISAFLFTLAFVFVVPLGFVMLVRFVAWLSSDMYSFFDLGPDPRTQMWFFQLVLAGFLLRRLHHKLATRSFPLDHIGA